MKVSIPAAVSRIRIGLVTVSILFSLCCSYGQYKNFSIQFDSILFRDFVDTVERTIPVRLYYSDKWTDTLSLSVISSSSTFEELMNNSLRKYGISFIITDDDRVILSKGYSIKTNFREEYLERLEKSLVKIDTLDYLHPAAIKEKSMINDEYRIFKIGRQSSDKKGERVVLSGNVVSMADGKYVGGAIVYIEKLRMGAMTNDAGFYSIILPAGQYQIDFRMIGLKTARRNVIIYSSGVLDVEMEKSVSEIEEVVITGSRSNVKEVTIGIEKINSKMLKQIPMGLGEPDLIKSSLLLPGVQSVGEASAGFNVRGGSADQNLIILNKTPILNPSHLFGFFSAFNSDLISNVVLYKSGIPAKYGGRLSSVMEIAAAEGNKEKVKVSGGISPVTGRLMVEGPLKKIKGSFIIGARAAYSDWILKMLKDYRLSNSSADFYDVQGLIKSEINKKNSVTLSGYLSNDKFDYYREYAFDYGSLAFTLKWTHAFSQKLSAHFYAIISNYSNTLDLNQDSTHYSTMNYKIDQKILRMEFFYYHLAKHKIEFGSDATFYSLMPGVVEPVGDYSIIVPKRLEKERALEPSFYLSDEYEVSPLLSVSAGLRGTLFASFGPGTKLQYQEGSSRSVESIIDTISYRSGEVIKFYPGLEYRLSARLIIAPQFSLKMGVQRVYQYIHMISNTTSMSPTDTWMLSDTYIKPQRSDQVSFGLYHTFGKKAVETSVEVYYKKLKNILDYKGGATLMMNEHLETDIINGIGKAYGIELLMKKQAGSITGWISYTYSRTLLRINGQYEVEKVNGGEYFPADYDKPHDLKLVVNSKFSRRFNMTADFMYSTGRPITYPVAFFEFNNGSHVYYSNRNEYRVPDYVRLDLAATLNGNLKAKKLNHSSLTFTVYNVLGRKNPYSIFFRTEEGMIQGYQMTIFSQPIFMLSYNFRILGNATGDF
jgi:hypothetical protein